MVFNAGVPVGQNTFIQIQVAGNDTFALTDSLGFYSTTVNPNVNAGTITVSFVDCRADTIRNTQQFDSLTTQIRADLAGCVPQNNIRIGGLISNYSGTPALMVEVSFNNFGSLDDTIPVNAFGSYQKVVNCQPQGTVWARLIDCAGNYQSSSIFYRTGDSINFDFNYCQVARVSGQVLLNAVPMSGDSAYGLLYAFDNRISQFVFSDSLDIDSLGDYDQVVDSTLDYVLKIMPKNGVSSFAATYYPNGITWDSRSTQALTLTGVPRNDVQLIQPLRGLGIGSISGVVELAANLDTMGYSAVGIHLLNDSDQVVGYTYASPSGNFSFSGLGSGSYRVWIDQCGIPTRTEPLELTPARNRIDNIRIVASREEVRMDWASGEFEIELAETQVYPNPVNQELHIDHAATAKLEVMDLQGRIKETLIISSDQFVLGTELWNPGIYFLRISQQGSVHTQKIVKR